MSPRTRAAVIALAAWSLATVTNADDGPPLPGRFEDVVAPLLKSHCLGCHGPAKPKAELDLSREAGEADVAARLRVWETVAERLELGDMPPDEAKTRPTEGERAAAVAWIKAVRGREAARNAGDPGPVPAHRLSNAEYDHTIRDLTGVDLRPTREFPVDPANEAGFDNSGESLAMSPALLKKSLDAAKKVADHLVLTPDGLAFAPHPAVTETDRDRYCVHRIVDFYERHKIDLADYFFAAWRLRHPLRREWSLDELAAREHLSPRYLRTVVETMARTWPEDGPFGRWYALWRNMPGDPAQAEAARRGCEALRDETQRLRAGFIAEAPRPRIRGVSPGSQPLVLWRNRRQAETRMQAPEGDAAPEHLRVFCRVFPDAFFLSERAPYFEAKAVTKGRLLTAGFHLMQGYFRDDLPLRELVLDDAERAELDRLWRDLDFVTLAPLRQYRDFIFFERAEPPRFLQGAAYDFARSEDKDATSAPKIERLRTAYLAKVREAKADATGVEAVITYFDEISRAIRTVEHDRLAAEPAQLQALLAFAGRAYRRPLTDAERDDLVAFYKELRETENLGHEDAIRDTLTRILFSPHFTYLVEPAAPGATAGPVGPYPLASRLSYALWASMPDNALLAVAASGDLTRPEVVAAQAQRMLHDPKVRGLATEFAGHWLGFRRFEEHNAVDRERFPAFTDALRQAMFEEPVRFVEDLFRRDGSVLELVEGPHTFVNPVLAKHYGIPLPASPVAVGVDGWFRVDDARPYGRGGVLPMAAFLTANAPGLRTSPVKRGFWVVRRILGETIPAPPPNVPELPKDEANTGDLTVPQLLARHRQVKSCATCHERFDSFGLVFEGYGPVGERRERDLAGRPLETRATFPDGAEGDGLEGLRTYLSNRRREAFLDNLGRKFLAYALGRGLRPSDEPTIDAIRAKLAASGFRASAMVEAVVTSPQFLNKRGRDDPRP